jgi:hypothetical protein
LLATYDFIQKISANHTDNAFKKSFTASAYNNKHYKDLIAQIDTLNIYESYAFQGYPIGQKTPVMTSSIIDKNLIHSSTIQQFKKLTMGIIPNTELFILSDVIEEFIPIYDSLIFLPNKEPFENKIKELKLYVQQSNISKFFQRGLSFYQSKWDYTIPVDIAVIPTIARNGLTARAFLINNAISEVPVSFKENAVLFSILMHEIYHNIYDGQSLALKLNIQSWFHQNSSKNSQYASLLLNEALATSLGNGYVYEELTGVTDSTDWYNDSYINLMAKRMYPLVKEYITQNKSIDKPFIDKYISLYDSSFSDWSNQLDYLLKNRFIISDSDEDFGFFNMHYPYSSNYISKSPVNLCNIEHMAEQPITKIVIVSNNNSNKLHMIKTSFKELLAWRYNPTQEFVYSVLLQDKTKLIIINKHGSSLEKMFETYFKNKRTQ